MKSKLAWVFVLGCAGLSGLGAALAVAGDANPYEVISDRNIFHLNPEPLAPPAPPPKPPDLPKVMLTGFVGKGSTTKILLAIIPKDTKEATYYACLVPGQEEHGVQLVNIHLEKEAVDIINSGTPETLTVESNSYESMASAPPSRTGPREPRMPPGMRFQPGMMFRRQPRG